MSNSLLIFLSICLMNIYTPDWAVTQFAEMERINAMLPENTIIDAHNDTMMHVVDEDTWLPTLDIGESTNLELDIPKAQAGGLDVAFFAAFTEGYIDNNPRSISRTLALLYALYWTEENNSSSLQIAKETKEISNIVEAGKLAAVPTIEGAYSLEEDNAIGLIQQYLDLGVRVIGFNWNYSNALGEGADRTFGDEAKTPSTGGLTTLGEEVVKEMNRLGMVIDTSHMDRETFQDVLEVTDAPVIASHSGVYSLKKHPRNLTDEEMLTLKENGGVLSIVFFPYFLSDNPVAYVSDIADHIDYAVDLIGIDHVGIGSDFDGATLPEDLPTARELPRLEEELTNRGYTTEEIEKILGGNLWRVLRENEEQAEVNWLENNGPSITAELEMGESVSNRTPTLKAEINTELEALEPESFDIIVDGISYEPTFDEETATLILEMEERLEEKFHVVTFQAASHTGKVTRETIIFYIEDES